MTEFLSALFALAAIAATLFGASTLQLGLAVEGVLFFGLFVIVGSIAGKASDTRRGVEDILDRLDDARPAKRKDAAPDFNSAVALYQKQTGQDDAAAALRSLAAEALKRQGLLQ
jgi:hypothetical protein